MCFSWENGFYCCFDLIYWCFWRERGVSDCMSDIFSISLGMNGAASRMTLVREQRPRKVVEQVSMSRLEEWMEKIFAPHDESPDLSTILLILRRPADSGSFSCSGLRLVPMPFADSTATTSHRVTTTDGAPVRYLKKSFFCCLAASGDIPHIFLAAGGGEHRMRQEQASNCVTVTAH